MVEFKCNGIHEIIGTLLTCNDVEGNLTIDVKVVNIHVMIYELSSTMN